MREMVPPHLKETDSPRLFNLGFTFRMRNGFTGMVLKREGKVILVKKNHRQMPNNDFYEVMVIRTSTVERRFPNGAVLPIGTERLPSTEEWGKYGWTPHNEDQARERFRQTCDRFNKP
ncbi:MAG: hypothetical protein EHM23_26660 [Acidobacteria bacterium]|jgi:hypothetical protein|nr:MAG: hypothetical protein EHM23_26660 [Acidobacteriota bacterium]